MEELTSALKGIMHYWWQDKAKHLFIIPDTVLRETEGERERWGNQRAESHIVQNQVRPPARLRADLR